MTSRLADPSGSFTWIAVGDHFDEPAPGLMARLLAARPRFVVGVGDLVFRSHPDDFAALKRVVMEPLAAAGARFYPVVGNHDFPVEPHWARFWEPPADRMYYSFDYGNSHFVILDTNQAFLTEGGRGRRLAYEPGSEYEAIRTQAQPFLPGSAQYAWLLADLAATTRPHVFVFFHEPAFSYGGHEGSEEIQAVLCPLFEQYRVTAVFSGHSHGYERFVPLRVDLSGGAPEAAPDAQEGVVHIVTAGGGKPIYPIAPHATHAAIAEAFHFVQVEVQGETMHGTVIEAGSGTVLDSFALQSRRSRRVPADTQTRST